VISLFEIPQRSSLLPHRDVLSLSRRTDQRGSSACGDRYWWRLPEGGSPVFDRNRRDFITLLGGGVATCPLVARAQQTVRVLRVGFVGGQPRDAAIYVAFRKRMAELGYRDSYFTFEYIQTPSIDAYDASFRELAARKPDIVIAAGNEPALRA